jgi:RNA polymerase sigma-70 factor (ECF subfamily)
MSTPAERALRYDREHASSLRALAYRMLGSRAEAEDIVQEAWLRWAQVDEATVQHAGAYLSRLVTNLCLDKLGSAAARREQYVGVWLPEPLVDEEAGWSPGPEAQAEFAQDVSVAFMLALERLSPLERAAFLLHDVFDFSFSEIATALDRSEAACRQLAARGRAHVRAARPRGATTPPPRSSEIDAKHAELMSAFLAATRSGDLNGLTHLLASDVRVITDGGGKVAAALNVLEGPDRAASFLIGAVRKGWRDEYTLRFALINDLPGIIVDGPEGVVQTSAFEIDGDTIKALYVVRNSEKLRHVPGAPAGQRRSELP